MKIKKGFFVCMILTVVLSVLFLPACPSPGGGGSAPDFPGTWMYNAGIAINTITFTTTTMDMSIAGLMNGKWILQ